MSGHEHQPHIRSWNVEGIREEAAERLDEPTARTLLDKIKAGLDELRDAIIQLWEGRGWVALGDSSWDDLCQAEFQLKLQLP